MSQANPNLLPRGTRGLFDGVEHFGSVRLEVRLVCSVVGSQRAEMLATGKFATEIYLSSNSGELAHLLNMMLVDFGSRRTRFKSVVVNDTSSVTPARVLCGQSCRGRKNGVRENNSWQTINHLSETVVSKSNAKHKDTAAGAPFQVIPTPTPIQDPTLTSQDIYRRGQPRMMKIAEIAAKFS